MCHVVKNRIRRKNTQRAYCIREEGYECAFFLPKIKSAFDKFTNMSCDGCEAEDCASACQTWINEHDAAIARKAREDVAELLDDVRKYANGEYKEADLSDNEREMRIHLEYENRIWGIMKSLRSTTPQSEQGGSSQ